MKLKLIPVGILILMLFSACSININKNNSSTIEQWVQNNGHEIKTLVPSANSDDLGLLNDIVGDASVVCLGESRHDIHEQFLIKHRMVRYLVEELGFTVFIIEGSLPYSRRIDAYILNGEGNIDEIMSDMPGWFLWDTAEILDMILWMRDYNSNPENTEKIRFYGIDIVAPNDALNQVFSFMQKYDQTAFKGFRNTEYAQDYINDEMWPQTRQAFEGFSDHEQQLLDKNYRDLYEHFVRNEANYTSLSSSEEYAWVLRMAYCAQEANKMFSSNSTLKFGLTRDMAMAQNALWIKEHLKDEKIIVWAHNVHIATDDFTMSLEEGSIKGMGYHLKKELGDEMISIGAAFNAGEYPEWNKSFPPSDSNSIDGILAKSGMEYAMFDLKKDIENESVKNWMNTKQVLRAQDFEMYCIPIKSFDGFFFVEHISRAIPNQRSSERFRGNN